MNESSTNRDNRPIRTGSALVEITCPAWCGISADEHASRLWPNEGRCIHQTVVTVADPIGKRVTDEAPRFCEPIELVLLVTTDPPVERSSPRTCSSTARSRTSINSAALQGHRRVGEMYRTTPGRRTEL